MEDGKASFKAMYQVTHNVNFKIDFDEPMPTCPIATWYWELIDPDMLHDYQKDSPPTVGFVVGSWIKKDEAFIGAEVYATTTVPVILGVIFTESKGI